ncbi:MAG: hypothetical protein ACYCOU_01335 [Sulfobacillus sp.]
MDNQAFIEKVRGWAEDVASRPDTRCALEIECARLGLEADSIINIWRDIMAKDSGARRFLSAISTLSLLYKMSYLLKKTECNEEIKLLIDLAPDRIELENW